MYIYGMKENYNHKNRLIQIQLENILETKDSAVKLATYQNKNY